MWGCGGGRAVGAERYSDAGGAGEQEVGAGRREVVCGAGLVAAGPGPGFGRRLGAVVVGRRGRAAAPGVVDGAGGAGADRKSVV